MSLPRHCIRLIVQPRTSILAEPLQKRFEKLFKAGLADTSRVTNNVDYESSRGRMQSQPESPDEAVRAIGAKRGQLKRSEIWGSRICPKAESAP